jgi:hypothetical protein
VSSPRIPRGIACLAIAAALVLGGAPAARAQVWGQYSGAEAVPMNGHLFGAYLNASENDVGLAAQLRLSFYPSVDFGFMGGLDRVSYETEDRTILRLGTDLKVQARSVQNGAMLDLALGGALGVESGDDWQLITVGPQAVASRLLGGAEGGATLFVGAAFLFTNIDVGDNSSTDFSVPLRLGAEWRLVPGMRLTGELQVRISDDFNDDVSFALGTNLPF